MNRTVMRCCLALLIVALSCQIACADAQFKTPPSIHKKGSAYVVSFEVASACDVTVAIVDKKGRIIRHLVSGVLGPNAPMPLKQDTLKQSIGWDGKTDAGKMAPAGCKVKVALELTPHYGGTLGFNPYHIRPWSVACGPDGTAYVFTADGIGGDIQIRAFSREGQFLRYVQPIAGGLKREAYDAQFNIVETPSGPIYLPKAQKIKNPYHRIVRGMGSAVSPNGRLAFMDSGHRVKMYLNTLNTDGSNLRIGSQVGPWQRATGRALCAFDRDGNHVYVSSLLPGGPKSRRENPYHCVLRVRLEDPTPDVWRGEKGFNRNESDPWGGVVPAFVGQPYKAGDDNEHLNDPRGVSVDKDGNVYIADFGNNRIQVFTDDAMHLRTLPIEKPDRIAVHRKTGDIYVLVPTEPSQVVKLSPKGEKLASFEFPGYRDGNQGYITTMALDDSVDPPIIWLGLPDGQWNKWNGLWRVADRGDSFEKLGDVARLDDWNVWGSYTNQYLAVDPEDRWLHMKNDRSASYPRVWGRVDVKTGEIDGTWHTRAGVPPADEVCYGPDGLLYGRTCKPSTRGEPEYIWRFDPVTEKEVPFPAGEDGRITFTGWHSPKFHRDGFDVAPNGDVYVLQHINAKAADFTPEPWRSSVGFTPLFLNHFGADGKLKRKDILPGVLPGPGGLRVDHEGSIYMPLHLRKRGRPIFDLLPNVARSDLNELTVAPASLCKFGADGGRIMMKQEDGDWSGYGAKDPTIKVEGITASYAGLSPFGSGCVCKSCRIDLDGFSRSFAPIYHLSCVMVLDTNLNPIVRIGTYGGPIEEGDTIRHVPELGMSRPAYVTANDHALYIADVNNRCILRVAISYAVERSVPVPE